MAVLWSRGGARSTVKFVRIFWIHGWRQDCRTGSHGLWTRGMDYFLQVNSTFPSKRISFRHYDQGLFDDQLAHGGPPRCHHRSSMASGCLAF